MAENDVMIYALSTCPWCLKAKGWFEDEQIPFRHVDIDALDQEQSGVLARKAEEISGGRRFPVTVVNGVVIVGFQPERFAAAVRREDGKAGVSCGSS